MQHHDAHRRSCHVHGDIGNRSRIRLGVELDAEKAEPLAHVVAHARRALADPGRQDAGVDSARRAVQLRPHYPPNLLVLGEALAKTGDAKGAHDAYTQARDAAQALPPDNADRDGWIREADQGLQHK